MPSRRPPAPARGAPTSPSGRDVLAKYRERRNFARSPEPSGETAQATEAAATRALGAELQFVVQRHAARREHYDFRLELGGVLKSWSVPKGPSLDPEERRLAIETEDHPLGYGEFEGVIPAGEYGGGTVLLWDRGRWIPEGDPEERYTRGRLKFSLQGEKLRGAFSLVRLPKSDQKNAWLLTKVRDEDAVPGSGARLLEERPESVLSGQSIDAIAQNPSRTWRSNRAAADTPSPRNTRPSGPVRVQGVVITNPARVVFEESGITKAAVAEWLARAGAAMLPHVARRPLMLLRCPEGRGPTCFHQKHAATKLGHAKTQEIEEGGERQEAIYVDSVDGLISLAQLGVLEVHTWGSRFDHLEHPDLLVFDLDPAEDVAFPDVVRGARAVRELLTEIGLASWVKTTGGKGLHVVAPIEPELSWDQTKDFARAVAHVMVRRAPTRYVATMTKARRPGKVFVDFFRNGRGATFIAPFSLRARPGAPVALPLEWEELDELPGANAFTLAVDDARIERARRAWAGLLEHAQSIDVAVIERLQGAARAT